MKKFTIPCDFDGVTAPFNVYVGEPVDDAHPFEQQAAWLLRQRGGVIPQQAMDQFASLRDIARDNNVSFEELTVYAIGAASAAAAEEPAESSS